MRATEELAFDVANTHDGYSDVKQSNEKSILVRGSLQIVTVRRNFLTSFF